MWYRWLLLCTILWVSLPSSSGVDAGDVGGVTSPTVPKGTTVITNPIDGLKNSTDEVISQIEALWGTVSTKVGVALLIIVGVVLLILGYRLFRVTFFLAAFFFAGSICYFFLHKYCYTSLDIKYQIIIAASVGLVAGLIALFMLQVGFFVAGCLLGFFLATLAFSVVVPIQGTKFALLTLLSEPWQYYVILFCSSVFTGLLALTDRMQKFVLITGTSLAGSFCVMCFIDFYAQTGFSSAIVNILVSIPQMKHIYFEISGWAWGLFAGCIVLALLGIYIQYRLVTVKLCFGRRSPPPAEARHLSTCDYANRV
eukprot:RCo050256